MPFQSCFACLLFAIGLSLGGVAFADEPNIDDGWRYSLLQPRDNWMSPDFDDSKWTEATGGFGKRDTPGARLGTEWTTDQIWLRRTVVIDSVPAKPALLMHHDEDVIVYVNGVKVIELGGWSSNYELNPLSTNAAAAIKAGKNRIAVYCKQTSGGQFIDVHLVDADNVPKLPLPKRPDNPFKTELITEWGANVTAENAWRQYPRPGLIRDGWTNLNGYWDYKITSNTSKSKPNTWDGKILVPFAPESKLSGVEKLVDPDEKLWYSRVVELNPQKSQRTLLHFEAVDYRSEVFVNGQSVGKHVGGNNPFSFDITKAARKGKNEIVVVVEDETEAMQLNGKQRLNPGGIFYTQVTGIWQTVWVEQVPAAYIEELDISTDIEVGSITISPTIAGDQSRVAGWRVGLLNGRLVGDSNENQAMISEPITIEVENVTLWSPGSPQLYEFAIDLLDANGEIIDTIKSYAGIRSVGKVRDENGHFRLTLNGVPIFHFGPLDQGWWPDGLLTPPSEEAMLFDVEYLKDAGFNMIRKHIKVEPRRYYYDCDRLGMMLWQDQVSGGTNPPWTRMTPNPTDATWSDADHQQFMAEFEEMVDELEFHPSIVVWTPFNEAWGQHRTIDVGNWMLNRDPSRTVNVASGGNFWPVGDIADHHEYPHPAFPFDVQDWSDYVKVAGEFGGHGLPIEGHLYDPSRDNWGYGGLPKDKAEYKERYEESIRRLVQLKKQGIAGGVYTQTTDVEIEINGLMTYDRKVIKIQAEELKRLHSPLYK